jgi:hypothetical protein
MALTGRADGPALGAPRGFVERVWGLEATLARHSDRAGGRVEVDGLALLGERAALAGLRRAGDRSCGGATRLLRTGGGWLVVSLARPTDVELLPAWLEGDATPEDPWATVERAVAEGDAAALAARAQLLGLPVAALPDGPVGAPVGSPPHDGLPVRSTPLGSSPPATIEGMLVADLSSLWAGPLCAQLLGQAGARVVKVESLRRPDGARFGPPAFFDLLHAGHESVALDFAAAEGREDLSRLLHHADIVIEASRPRALRQLGIEAETVLRSGRPRVWLSITGYGRSGGDAQRVAFGDDGAVAGGLVVWDSRGPCFCADAVADPTAGLAGAAAVLASLAAGGRWLLDVSLRGVAAHLAAGTAGSTEAAIEAQGGTVTTPGGPVPVAEPRARRPSDTAPVLGAHTEAVLAEAARGRP